MMGLKNIKLDVIMATKHVSDDHRKMDELVSKLLEFSSQWIKGELSLGVAEIRLKELCKYINSPPSSNGEDNRL